MQKIKNRIINIIRSIYFFLLRIFNKNMNKNIDKNMNKNLINFVYKKKYSGKKRYVKAPTI